MNNLINLLEEKNIVLPANIIDLLNNSRNYQIFNSVDDLCDAATGGKENLIFDVTYDIPGKGKFKEVEVHRVTNGISANYTEAYMRRRDPNTMVIADDLPTDKPKFKDKYGYSFSKLQDETFAWLQEQDLAVFFYFAGRNGFGSTGMAIAPANAAFFAMGLAMLQEHKSVEELEENTVIESVIYVAPTFRHTHFEGKQVVVHNRTDKLHEIYSYNLYPGPSAKKGLYGVLIAQGEREKWITAHCSAVQAISPYDNITTFMHEGASGGGKSEMHQQIMREYDGRVLIGKNNLSGEKRYITIPRFVTFNPIADDMALCHTSFQTKNGKLRIIDAENSWFIRVDGVTEYGKDPSLENYTINTTKPLVFLNVDTHPGATALIWNHIEDEPGKRCPNPRVILPREIINNVVSDPISIDVRSFGIRTPICSKEVPSYGIMGLFHILPPALAWLWRLTAPRGHKNPSIISNDKLMQSEGVGSYWPFSTGKKVKQANLLLQQIIDAPNTVYTLAPNQFVGVWNVGFRPQLLMREYLTRRGGGRLRREQYQPARSSVLGFELKYLTLESSKIPSRFLQVYKQPEVGKEGYDAGAAILTDFFKRELKQYMQEDLNPIGKRIIEAFYSNASVEEYIDIIPMIQHSFMFDSTS